MDDILIAIILGVVQGLTEFLPVSSSGHLEIMNQLLNTNYTTESNLLMTTVLHAATAFSIIYVFRKEIKSLFIGLFKLNLNNESLFSLKIIISMIPAVIIGLLLEEKIELLFRGNLILVGSMLIITAILLFFADIKKNVKKEVSFVNAFLIGLAQAIAILPGISRSGATISTAVLLGSDKEKASKFSFLMVVPLILGKMFKDLSSGEIDFSQNNLPLLFGFITAFLVGLFACKWMIRLVKNSQLKYFSYYCLLIGSLVIISQIYAT